LHRDGAGCVNWLSAEKQIHPLVFAWFWPLWLSQGLITCLILRSLNETRNCKMWFVHGIHGRRRRRSPYSWVHTHRVPLWCRKFLKFLILKTAPRRYPYFDIVVGACVVTWSQELCCQ
jgi:hypothetical protein